MEALSGESTLLAPLAVGIDLVAVPDVAESIERFGSRYVDRLFTSAESRYCRDGRTPCAIAERFAARFAAKEAAMKVMRWGDRPTDWRAFEVVHQSDGAARLVLHGAPCEVARATGVSGFALSMTHEAGYAMAVVTAWRTGASGTEQFDTRRE